MERQKQYRISLDLLRGLLKAGDTKEVTFHIKAIQPGTYTLICIVQSFAKRAEKEASLLLNLK